MRPVSVKPVSASAPSERGLFPVLRQLSFLLVGTLVLWYLGHFGINGVLQLAAPGLPGSWSRAIDLLLVPVAALVTWLVMRRLESGREPQHSGEGQSDTQ